MDTDAERKHENVTVVIDHHEDEHVVTQQPDHYSVSSSNSTLGCRMRSSYISSGQGQTLKGQGFLSYLGMIKATNIGIF